jgi:hypothetical protein
VIILGNDLILRPQGASALVETSCFLLMIPRCLMLEFLVAQNWEGAEASGPRALRSSRSGIQGRRDVASSEACD